jgi:predicted esterase
MLDNSSPSILDRFVSMFPESLQVELGGKMLSLRPDLISVDENSELMALADPIYTELEGKPAWSNLPNSLAVTYEDTIHLNPKPDQYFVYMPNKFDGNVIIFTHGYGGNFKSYLYLLSFVAEDTNSVIIAPTYEAGVWDKQGIEFIDESIDDALIKYNVQPTEYIYVGLSNGGLPMADFISNTKFKFSKVVALSTYLDDSELQQPAFKDKAKSIAFLYLYGNNDQRIGFDSSLATINSLNSEGFNFTSKELEGDHFILFSQREKVLNEITQFINE